MKIILLLLITDIITSDITAYRKIISESQVFEWRFHLLYHFMSTHLIALRTKDMEYGWNVCVTIGIK